MDTAEVEEVFFYAMKSELENFMMNSDIKITESFLLDLEKPENNNIQSLGSLG
jgi:hypothetical protein